MNICGSSEKYLATREPLSWLLWYLFISFILFLAANWLDVSDASFSDQFPKRIGLYWSVNWTITFLLLYPVFLFLAIRGTKAVHGFWRDAADWQLITGRDGRKKDITSLLQEWSTALGKCNGVAVAFILICFVIAGTDFYAGAGPLRTCAINFTDPASDFRTPIDWSTIRIVKGTCRGYEIQLLLLLSSLYGLLIVSLAFYLIYLFYSAFVFNYLAKISRRDGDESRLVFRQKQLRDAITPTVENLMMSVILGLSVCALMEAHSTYLQSPDLNTAAFLTGDVQRLANIAGSLLRSVAQQSELPDGSQRFLEYQHAVVSRGLTIIPLVMTIVLCGVGGMVQLYDAVRNALLYTQDKLHETVWRERVGFTEQDELAIKGMDTFSAFLALVPQYGLVYLAICGLLILSIVFSSFLIFLLSAIVIFMYRLVSQYLLPGPSHAI